MLTSIRMRAGITLFVVALLLTLSLAPPVVQAQSPVVRPHPNGQHLVAPDGRRLFVFGYNYEGPYDRAWRMWQQFDPVLIEADFIRAKAGGANTLRVFVQEPLPAEIMAGDFAKLDTVVNLAARHGLYLLLTFSDYAERDLAAIGAVNQRIAARYRGNATILGFNLRNEPQFLTLAGAVYPPGVSVPLQRNDMVAIYGERVANGSLAAFRGSRDGRVLPGWWSDELVYAYANNLAYYREFLHDAERWTLAAPGRSIADFPSSPQAARWQPFWQALDQTLAAWIAAQRDPVYAVNPEHMITIGWNNPLLARLPANGAVLDFMALHRYPRPGLAAIEQIVNQGAALRRAFPSRPLLFEEIGFSTHEIDPQGAAVIETAVALRAYSEGYAGFLKWMLTDLPPVGNPREDNFGALRIDGSPKPVFQVFGAFGTYLTHSAADPGGAIYTWSDDQGGWGYTFETNDAVYIGGPGGAAAGVGVTFPAPGQLTLRKQGALYLLATQPGAVTLNLRELQPVWTGAEPLVEARAGEGWEAVAASRNGDELRFDIQPNRPHRVLLQRYTDPAQPRADCRYFPETGHNLCGAFLRYWEANGGLTIFGYPISAEFNERSSRDGQVYLVQYFERNRFEYHPANAGTPYEVLLGLLGNDLARGRGGEAPFQPVSDAEGDRTFFPETGHTLGGVFRDYWVANGGLAVFGFPISEEFFEYNPADGRVYRVQYFERNRFEYHPENAGTPYEVLLGLLGNRLVDGQGWR